MRARPPLWFAGLAFALAACGLAACGATPPPAPPPPPPAPKEDPTSVVKVTGGAFDPDDKDGDGIADVYDLCPGLAEDGLGAHPWDGCPDARDPVKRVTPWGASPRQAVKVTRGEIKISEEVRFGSGSAAIDPSSQSLLQSIAQVLKDVPEIEIVEVAGHADALGKDAENKRLTEARAKAVVRDLVKKGIPAARLRASGYSAWCAIDAGTDDAARAKNRRVELRILRRDGKDLEPRWAGCAEAERHGMKPPALPPLPPPQSATSVPEEDRKRAKECSEGEAKPCAKRCDHGEASACEALANLWAGDDPKRALAAATRACDLGALHFCVRVAGYLREGKGAPKDPARAHKLVIAACDRGNARACAASAADLRGGAGVTKDDAKAAALDLRACDQGDGGGCLDLGESAWNGRGVPKDRRRGHELFAAGCELGSADACARIATAFKEEPAALRDRPRALAALHVACHQDDSAPACEALAALDEQPGEHKDLPVCAAGDFKACRAACDKEPASAPCVELGVAMLYGVGVRKRTADATALFIAACGAGSAKACTMSAIARTGDSDDPKAERLAASELEAACALGEASGCVNHALMELEGLGTYRDEEAAWKALDAACTQGVGIACAHLGAMAKRRVGAPAGMREEPAYRARACKAGFRPACP